MIERAAKRRKVSDASEEGFTITKKQVRHEDIHTEPVDDRFEDFDDDEEEEEVEDDDDDDEDEEDDAEEEEGDAVEDDAEEEENGTSVDGQDDTNKSESRGQNVMTSKSKSQDTHATNGNGATQRVVRQLGAPIANSTSTASQSSLFKLQVEEMLRQVAPDYGKKEAPAVDMLKKVKDHIERIPDRAPQTVRDGYCTRTRNSLKNIG